MEGVASNRRATPKKRPGLRSNRLPCSALPRRVVRALVCDRCSAGSSSGRRTSPATSLLLRADYGGVSLVDVRRSVDGTVIRNPPHGGPRLTADRAGTISNTRHGQAGMPRRTLIAALRLKSSFAAAFQLLFV